MERVRQFFSAILAGMLIGMGGTVFLSQSNPVVGSFLFAIGLFTSVVFQLHLFLQQLLLVVKIMVVIHLQLLYMLRKVWLLKQELPLPLPV